MFNRMVHFRKNNKGSSYVLVISAISLIAILIAIVFTLVSMLFMSQSLSRRNKDNFYYIEKALDEMRTGVGNTCLQKLNSAYEDTVSQVVYYDTDNKKYMTKPAAVANTLMKEEFIDLVGQEYMTSDDDSLHTLLDGFITSKTEGGGTLVFNTVAESGFSFGEIMASAGTGGDEIQGYSFKNVMVSRTDSKGNTESITTDIEILPPDFDVNFLSSTNDVDTLFSYAVVADYGIDITGTGANSVGISGNVFAGLDHGRNNMIKTKNVAGTVVDANAGLGDTKNSKYSGIYVSNAKLTLQSNTVICPGYMTACGNASIDASAKAKSSNRATKSNLWVDNIVTLDDASAAKTPKLYLNAICNVSDDLELNAEKSNVIIDGAYYGYSLGLTEDLKSTKNHSNSSAIVVNGKKSTLNLSKLSTLVVSGSSYVDLKKEPDGATPNTMDGSNEVKDYRTGESISSKGNQLAYRVDSADYVLKDKLDADGNQVKDEDGNAVKEVTGATLDLFLKYMKWYNGLSTTDKDSGKYMLTDAADLEGYDKFIDFVNGKYNVDGNDYTNTLKNSYHMVLNTSNTSVKVVAYYIKNEYYYFFEFEDSTNGRDGKAKFAVDYARFVKATSGVREDYTSNDVFPVDQIIAPTNTSVDSYTSGAITTKDETKDNVEIKEPVGSLPVVNVRNTFFNKYNTYNLLQFMLKADESEVETYNGSSLVLKTDPKYNNINLALAIMNHVSGGTVPFITNVTNGVTTHQATYNSLTPLNYYVNWDWDHLTWGDSVTYGTKSEALINPSMPEGQSPSGAYIWVQEDDVTIDGKALTGSDNARIKGICICKGNVTIQNVERFDGVIITAGKMYIPQSCTLVANEESMKNVLENDVEEFDSSGNHEVGTGVLRKILGLEPIAGNTKDVEPGVDVSVIDSSTLVGYNNWVKNGTGSKITP